MQSQYDTWTRRIAALDTDIGRALGSLEKQVLEERRGEVVADERRSRTRCRTSRRDWTHDSAGEHEEGPMPDPPTRHDVFLSHNNADKPAVEELACRLVQAGLHPWLDTWNLIPGDPWQEAIEVALQQCASCAVLIGPSGTGPWQNEEMHVAIDRRVSESEGAFRVMPVLLPGAERGERTRLPDFLVRATLGGIPSHAR